MAWPVSPADVKLFVIRTVYKKQSNYKFKWLLGIIQKKQELKQLRFVCTKVWVKPKADNYELCLAFYKSWIAALKICSWKKLFIKEPQLICQLNSITSS
jgi:hypothetical protein